MTALSLIYVTTPTKDEALKIGRTLLEKKIAACINVWEGMESHYWWEGKIETALECVLLVKTTDDKVDAAIAVVKAMHGYTTPCAIAWKIEKGNPEYVKWLEDAVGR